MSPSGAKEWTRSGHTMWLLPERAVWWPERSTLVLSDLHLAKAEHFRSKGLAVPPTVDMQTLSVLTDLMRRFKPNSLAFLGDLFHSAPNRAWGDFEHWLEDEFAHGLKEGLLVRGNHDRAHDDTYRGMGMDVVDLWEAEGVVFTHDPEDEIPKGMSIHLCGHIHPAVRLHGKGRQTEQVPCYVESSTGCDAGWRLTLPAFGAFTGTKIVEPRRGSEVYVPTGIEVLGPWRSKPRSSFNRPNRK